MKKFLFQYDEICRGTIEVFANDISIHKTTLD